MGIDVQALSHPQPMIPGGVGGVGTGTVGHFCVYFTGADMV